MKKGLRAALTLLLTVLLCIAANVVSFGIDTTAMREHAAQGAAMLCAEGGAPQQVGGFRSAQLDNYTAVLILKTAAYTGPESLLLKALGGTRTDMPAAEGQDAWEAYCTYADGSLSPTGGLTYSRYWHGYTLPLRLLLCVLNLANIQMLLLYVQLALVMLVCLLLVRRGLGALLPALGTAYFLMMPTVMGVCLQYAPVSLLMLSFCALLLAADVQLDHFMGLPACFALFGLLTNYFDLLTFPVVTLCFPLVLLIALRLRAEIPLRALLGQALCCCIGWGLGFALMWALKWLLVALIFGADRLLGVMEQIGLRVSSQSGSQSLSRLGVLMLNAQVILSKSAYLLLVLLTFAAALGQSLLRVLRHGAKLDLRALALLLPALIPIAFTLVMANHSFDHTYYTYRNLTGLFFALPALCTLCTRVSGQRID